MNADQEAMKQADIQSYLEQVNEQFADICFKNTNKLLGDMVGVGTKRMKLNFSLND
ncbi:hypothetical protein [Rummeliibacillus sp. POC4]|mgnify:FL=1|nr:hypothetical protein [Rummeliibacillus sp. POC4]